MKAQKDSLFLKWANLVDIGFQSALGNLKKTRSLKNSLREIKDVLLRHSEEHWKILYKTLKRMK